MKSSTSASSKPRKKTSLPQPASHPSPNVPIVWALCDDRAGNVSQCLGVAERLSFPYTVKQIRYNQLASLPNLLLGARLNGLTGESRAEIAPPWPDLVIAAGRRTAPVARYIKRENGRNTKLVQLMWPEAGVGEFDLIVLPQHDVHHMVQAADASRIMTTRVAPHRLTPEVFTHAPCSEWEKRIEPLPRPWFALLVGGNTRHGEFTPASARRLAEYASRFANNSGGSLLVTTSRRTGKQSELALFDALSAPAFIYEYGREENPYYVFLALAEAILVTADSVSMASEATYTGKPVYLFGQGAQVSPKHRQFAEHLYAAEMARPLDADAIFSAGDYQPEDAAADIAARIRQWFE